MYGAVLRDLAQRRRLEVAAPGAFVGEGPGHSFR
jgi:hypothetical protein